MKSHEMQISICARTREGFMPACQRLNLHSKCAESMPRERNYLPSTAADTYVQLPCSSCRRRCGQGGHKLGRNSTRKVSRRCSAAACWREKNACARACRKRERKIFSLSLWRVILRCRPHSSKSLKEPVQWFEVTGFGKSHRCQFLPAVKFPGNVRLVE